MAASETLLSIRDRALFAADMEFNTPGWLTSTNINAMINARHRRLRWMLRAAFGADYDARTASFSTASGTSAYALDTIVVAQTNFFQLIGAPHLYVTSTDPIELRRWELKEEVELQRQSANLVSNPRAIKYRLVNTSLELLPAPRAVYTVKFRYSPVTVKLTADGDTLDGINGFEDYIVKGVAAELARKGGEMTLFQMMMADVEAVERELKSIADQRDSANAPQIKSIGNPWSLDMQSWPHDYYEGA